MKKTGRIPFIYRLIRGAIGKKYVVRHYKGGRVVISRYPYMKDIIPSQKQRVQRRLFKKGVKEVQKIYRNFELREQWRRKLRRPHRLFQALMKAWFTTHKQKQQKTQQRIEKWKNNVMDNHAGWNPFKWKKMPQKQAAVNAHIHYITLIDKPPLFLQHFMHHTKPLL